MFSIDEIDSAKIKFVVGEFDSDLNKSRIKTIFMNIGCNCCTTENSVCPHCWTDVYTDKTSSNARISYGTFVKFVNDDKQQVLSVQSHIGGNVSAILEKNTLNSEYVLIKFPDCQFRDVDNLEYIYKVSIRKVHDAVDAVNNFLELDTVEVYGEELDNEIIELLESEKELE